LDVIVQKYGGTSLATPARIASVADRVVATRKDGHQVAVVVSAMGESTDELLALARKVSKAPPTRELDMLLTSGERIAMSLLAMAINDRGCPALSFTGSQSGIITDAEHTRAKIIEVRADRIRQALETGKVAIVAGFQGMSTEREITTLGRGGSDTTAVALAVALGARECEIYTDVDGVYTADPRVVGEARKLDRITYDEMVELASLGAQVLHPRSVELAAKHGLPVLVASSFDNTQGTKVEQKTSLEAVRVRGIASDQKVVLFTLPSVPRKVHGVSQVVVGLARQGIPIKLFFHGASGRKSVDLLFLVGEEHAQKAKGALSKASRRLGARGLQQNDGVGTVSVVGLGIGREPEILATFFEVASKLHAHIEAVSTSEIKITCVLESAKVASLARALHKAFKL
jgi:aspartate kinase